MKISVVFTDLAALEKEFQDNIKNGALSFKSDQALTRGQKVNLVLTFGQITLAELEANIMFSKGDAHGATFINFGSQVAENIANSIEEIRKDFAALDSKATPEPKPAEQAQPAEAAPEFKIDTQSPRAPVPSVPTVEGQAVKGQIEHNAEMALMVDDEKIAAALSRGEELTLPLHALLLTIYRHQLSGLLRLQLGERSKEFLFLTGTPIHATIKPKLKDEYLPMVLFRMGLIDPDQYKTANDERKKTTKKFGRILIEQGVIDEEKLRRGLELQSAVFFKDLFAAEKLSFEWIRGEPAQLPADPLQAQPLGVIFLGIQECLKSYFHFTELMQVLEPHKSQYPIPNPELTAAALQLDEKIGTIFTTVMNGHRNFREVFESSTFGRPDTSRVLVGFKILDAVQFLENPYSDLEKRGEEILNLVVMIDTINLFDLLHIHWASPDYYFERAYKKELARLGPKGEFALASQRVKDGVAWLRKKVEEAGKTICDKDKRCEYRLSLYGEDKCRFISDMKAQKGQLALFKNEIQEAYNCFVSAVEIDSKNPRAHMGLKEAKQRGGRPEPEK